MRGLLGRPVRFAVLLALFFSACSHRVYSGHPSDIPKPVCFLAHYQNHLTSVCCYDTGDCVPVN